MQPLKVLNEQTLRVGLDMGGSLAKIAIHAYDTPSLNKDNYIEKLGADTIRGKS